MTDENHPLRIVESTVEIDALQTEVRALTGEYSAVSGDGGARSELASVTAGDAEGIREKFFGESVVRLFVEKRSMALIAVAGRAVLPQQVTIEGSIGWARLFDYNDAGMRDAPIDAGMVRDVVFGVTGQAQISQDGHDRTVGITAYVPAHAMLDAKLLKVA
jgi:hypothetical protein